MMRLLILVHAENLAGIRTASDAVFGDAVCCWQMAPAF
jgi:hypothetical protein